MGTQLVNRINALLAEKGIPKTKFYEDCNISSASFSLWNTGKTSPKMKNLEVIADYLGTTVLYLLGGDEKTAETKKDPAADGRVTDEQLKFALAGDDGLALTDEDMDKIRAFAAFAAQERKKK